MAKVEVKFVYSEISEIIEVDADVKLSELRKSLAFACFKEKLFKENYLGEMDIQYPPDVYPALKRDLSLGDCIKAFSPITVVVRSFDQPLTSKALKAHETAAHLLDQEILFEKLVTQMEQNVIDIKNTKDDHLAEFIADGVVCTKGFFNTAIASLESKIEKQDLKIQKQDLKIEQQDLKIQKQDSKIEQLDSQGLKFKEEIGALNSKLNAVTRDLACSKSVHRLNNFISLFRALIVKDINIKKKEKFSDWIAMKTALRQCGESFLIDESVLAKGLSVDAWCLCSEFSHLINEEKHGAVGTEEACVLCQDLLGSPFERFIPSLSMMMDVFCE